VDCWSDRIECPGHYVAIDGGPDNLLSDEGTYFWLTPQLIKLHFNWAIIGLNYRTG
jgi:hypothetical protein